MTSNIDNTFWIYDPTVLIPNSKNIFSDNYSTIKIFNLLTIFLTVISAFLLIIGNKFGLVTLFCIILLVVIYFIMNSQKKEAMTEDNSHENINSSDTNTNTTSSNKKSNFNPVKNITMNEIIQSEDSNYSNNINNRITDIYLGDEYENQINDYAENSRDLYKYPEKNEKQFANWLYSGGETCKENSLMCGNFEDLRYHRSESDFEYLNSESSNKISDSDSD